MPPPLCHPPHPTVGQSSQLGTRALEFSLHPSLLPRGQRPLEGKGKGPWPIPLPLILKSDFAVPSRPQQLKAEPFQFPQPWGYVHMPACSPPLPCGQTCPAPARPRRQTPCPVLSFQLFIVSI